MVLFYRSQNILDKVCILPYILLYGVYFQMRNQSKIKSWNTLKCFSCFLYFLYIIAMNKPYLFSFFQLFLKHYLESVWMFLFLADVLHTYTHMDTHTHTHAHTCTSIY